MYLYSRTGQLSTFAIVATLDNAVRAGDPVSNVSKMPPPHAISSLEWDNPLSFPSTLLGFHKILIYFFKKMNWKCKSDFFLYSKSNGNKFERPY